MSTNRSVGRSAVTHKKDRSGLCSFTFADGRQCRTPRRAGHPQLCYFHAQKEAQSRAAKQAGEDVSYFLSGTYLSACDLTSALGRLFSAVAQGEIKPKTASALAYLGQTLNQSIQLAQLEYINAFGTEYWRSEVRSSVTANNALDAPTPPTAPEEAPDPVPPNIPCLRVTPHSPRAESFRMNTYEHYKSVSKQRTLTTFRINTYKKQGEKSPFCTILVQCKSL